MATKNQYATSPSSGGNQEGSRDSFRGEQLDGAHGAHDPMSHHQHPIVYFLIFAFLMLLLAITVGLYYLDLTKLPGWLQFPKIPGINLIVAMLVAIWKASLVVIYFMNVQKSSKLTWLFAALGFVWLIIMGGIFLDYGSRNWTDTQGWQ